MLLLVVPWFRAYREQIRVYQSKARDGHYVLHANDAGEMKPSDQSLPFFFIVDGELAVSVEVVWPSDRMSFWYFLPKTGDADLQNFVQTRMRVAEVREKTLLLT